MGRLRTARGGVPSVGSQIEPSDWTQNYGYDRYGNRTSVSANGVTANNQAVPLDGLASLNYQNQSNQTLTNRITTAGYEYDEAGNMLRGQAPNGAFQKFQYDAAGRLVKVMDDNSVEIESYAYGASRQRLRTIQGSLTTYYAWGGSSVLCEYTETTNNGGTFRFAKSYIYAGSRLLSTQIWNGTAEITEFHHPDRLGTKLVTNNALNTHYEQSTLPFGTSLDAEFVGTPTTNQRFTSYERSTGTNGTGLDYAVNRSYSSGQGRFTTVDPIGIASGSLGQPQSLNLYSYTQNNPIDFTDPTGLYWKFVSECSLENDSYWDGESWNDYYYWEYDEYWEWVEDPVVEPPGGGGGVPPQTQSPSTKKPCKQSNTGEDAPDIRELLNRAGLSDLLQNERASKDSPEGLVYDTSDPETLQARISANSAFLADTGMGSLHPEVGSSNTDNRSRLWSGKGLGRDTKGMKRSLQVVVGAKVNGKAAVYTDLDCVNPAEGALPALVHGIPIGLKKIGRFLKGAFGEH